MAMNSQKGGTLITKRLILKTIDKSYADSVLEYYEENETFLQQWSPEREDEFYSLDYQRDQIQREAIAIDEDMLFKVWLFKKEDKDFKKTIGSIALNNIVRGCFQSCFLGYQLDRNEINKGYMTEALKGVIDYAFNKLKLHRIEANIIPANKRSLRVVEKLGFENEGLAKRYLKINGQWVDHIHMVLLNHALE